MRNRLRLLLLAGVLVAMAGCRSLQVEAGFHTPAELTATAHAQPLSVATATPRPPTLSPTAALTPTTALAPTAAPSPTVPTPPPTGTAAALAKPGPTQPVATATPSASDPVAAIQTVLDYFGAVQNYDYPTAYGLWANGGTASGQTYDAFTKGYADTVHVSVQLGNPTEEGTSASRAVSVPATLESIVNEPNQSQSVRHYQGTYVLQPDSAGAWRISSASVTEVQSGAEPPADVADPTALTRSYFDAISKKELPRAYTYWDQLGEASGQTFAEFANGFSATAGVVVDVGQPRIGAAGGSSYAEVPVVVVAKQTDQTTRTYCGTYTDRRANVPPFDQLGWRIESAQVVATANVDPGSAMAQKLLEGACPTATPGAVTTPTPVAVAACQASDLKVSAVVQGATGNLAGSITFVNASSTPCTLQGRPDVKLVDATGQVLPVNEVAEPLSEAGLGSPVQVAPGQSARVFVIWLVNYCGPQPIPPIGMRVTLPGDQATMNVPLADARGTPLAGTPRCDQPGSGSSTLAVGLFQSAD